ncbi:MAG: PhoX family protein [Flavobacteriales bacterium]|nr:PhoX family protein [Flavobacteriales bacterium]
MSKIQLKGPWPAPLLAVLLFASCGSGTQTGTVQTGPFIPIASDCSTRTVIIPDGFTYRTLFCEGEEVVTLDGRTAAAKGMADLVIYIPIEGSSTHGMLYVGHETKDTSTVLGDGGGGTIMEIRKADGDWQVIGQRKAIDFGAVGQTLNNCGGKLAPKGTILTAEECEPTSNAHLMQKYNAHDTTDIFGRPRYQNYGWMVEVDPVSHRAVNRLWQMGRFMHEDAVAMQDGRTVYLSDDATPAVLFKFVADSAHDYTKGQLYAYAQSDDALSGTWLPLPMEIDSLVNARDVAMRRGATLFVRHEWMVLVGDRLYIAESGNDDFDLSRPISLGGRPAAHLLDKRKDHNMYSDPFGRILMLDLATDNISEHLYGGLIGGDPQQVFANPDAITTVNIKGTEWLVISEDLIWKTNGGLVGNGPDGRVYNEVYFLDLSIERPELTDLKRFMAGPRGCETTGNVFTPDGSTYFIAIQHPDTDNGLPFDRSCVIAIDMAPAMK